MKKYILLIVSAIVFAFTSCTSSEDIEINDIQSKYQAVFKVNPSTVVEPFTWQVTEGELSTIPTGNKLRVRALIYDNNGMLVYEHSEQFSNYNVLMDFSTELEKGEYTLIAISDVINPNPSEGQVAEYWVLGDYQHLNETKITSAGKIGYQREILGVVNKKISISSTNNEYVIDIKPAGAVVYSLYNAILNYEDIKRYQLNITQVVNEATFDSNGNLIGSLENNNNEYDWRLNIAYPNYDPYVYIINYVLPQKNLRLRFAGYTYTGTDGDNQGSSWWFGKELHVPSISAGDQFYFWIDVADPDDEYSVEYGKVNGLTYPNTDSSSAFLKESMSRGNVLYLKEFK